MLSVNCCVFVFSVVFVRYTSAPWSVTGTWVSLCDSSPSSYMYVVKARGPGSGHMQLVKKSFVHHAEQTPECGGDCACALLVNCNGKGRFAS